MRVLILTDNEYIYENFLKLILKKQIDNKKFIFRYSPRNKIFKTKYKSKEFMELDVKKNFKKIIEEFSLVFSLHSKQIFPKELVEGVRCINVHPGFNPYNRGWFPQVFSIINKKPCGVTIHEMDEQLDHGNIIFQKEVKVYDYDTSKSIYDRILKLEMELLENNLELLLANSYNAVTLPNEGNINYFQDFKKMCKLDLSEKLTMGEAIDKLRALTHGQYKNAYFINEKLEKIYISIELEEDKNEI